VIEAEDIMREKMLPSNNFIWILRQLVLRKVAEVQAQVVPLLKGTKLRMENYLEISLAEGGT
jgi:hypothetical protein